LIQEILEFIAPEADELGSQREMQHIEKILRDGTGADRQLTVWERTQDMKAVVDQIVAETYAGLELPEPVASSVSR
jgi:glutamate---cysteine ligase / carboxylate-amine ligase